MLLLRKPKPDALRRFLTTQADLGLSYPEIGATAKDPPAGYVIDHTRVKLGTGEEVFAAARSALNNWKQFELGWVSAWPSNTPIREHELIAVVARCLGLWWLNACRIVYVIDVPFPVAKFGFAYGALPGHVGAGEERFFVEMDGNGEVWYDILAFSRPNQLLARLGYFYMRRLQKRFGQQSSAAMQRIVSGHAR